MVVFGEASGHHDNHCFSNCINCSACSRCFLSRARSRIAHLELGQASVEVAAAYPGGMPARQVSYRLCGTLVRVSATLRTTRSSRKVGCTASSCTLCSGVVAHFGPPREYGAPHVGEAVHPGRCVPRVRPGRAFATSIHWWPHVGVCCTRLRCTARVLRHPRQRQASFFHCVPCMAACRRPAFGRLLPRLSGRRMFRRLRPDSLVSERLPIVVALAFRSRNL